MAEEVMVKCSDAELAALVQEERADAVKKFVQGVGAEVRQATGYFSTVRFQIFAVLVDPGPPAKYRLTIKAGERQAFAYKLGDEFPQIAGYVAPTGVQMPNANLSQTNLATAKQTRNGERYLCNGISAILRQGSDDGFAKLVWQNAFVELVMNDTDRKPLGPLDFFPALSSMNGQGDSYNIKPASAFDDRAVVHSPRGSEGTLKNFDLSKAPVIWEPAGKRDGSLYLAIGLLNDISIDVTNRVANAAIGVEPWNALAVDNSPPLGVGGPGNGILPFTFVDITFRLDGTSLSLMSQNQLPAKVTRTCESSRLSVG